MSLQFPESMPPEKVDMRIDANLSMTPDEIAAKIQQLSQSQPTVSTGKHLATQTQYPWRTSVRTGVATLLLILGAVAAISTDPTVNGFLSAHFPNLLPKVLAIGVLCGALATVIKRIGSIPAVARLFVRLGLGVVPKSALK